MHSIIIISGNITSTGLAQSAEAQQNAQASYSQGGFSVNRIAQGESNSQDQAAVVDISHRVGGQTPDPSPVPSPPPGFHLPLIFVSTKKVKGISGTDNTQEQSLYQDAVVGRGGAFGSIYASIFDPEEGRGPLARNVGLQDQGSDQAAESDVSVRTKVGDPQGEKPQEPAAPPPDPTVIVDETESTAATSNQQNQVAGQSAKVKPQNIDSGENGAQDPALNELGQRQAAVKQTHARNATDIIVAPGGWYDPWRVGVGPTTIRATRTLAGASSMNAQGQAYDQAAVAHSGLARERAENTAQSRQSNDSDTDASNAVTVLYRTNAHAPMRTTVRYHAALAEDGNDQAHIGSQAASSSGLLSRSRNRATTMQSNGQLVRSDMKVLVDA